MAENEVQEDSFRMRVREDKSISMHQENFLGSGPIRGGITYHDGKGETTPGVDGPTTPELGGCVRGTHPSLEPSFYDPDAPDICYEVLMTDSLMGEYVGVLMERRDYATTVHNLHWWSTYVQCALSQENKVVFYGDPSSHTRLNVADWAPIDKLILSRYSRLFQVQSPIIGVKFGGGYEGTIAYQEYYVGGKLKWFMDEVLPTIPTNAVDVFIGNNALEVYYIPSSQDRVVWYRDESVFIGYDAQLRSLYNLAGSWQTTMLQSGYNWTKGWVGRDDGGAALWFISSNYYIQKVEWSGGGWNTPVWPFYLKTRYNFPTQARVSGPEAFSGGRAGCVGYNSSNYWIGEGYKWFYGRNQINLAFPPSWVTEGGDGNVKAFGYDDATVVFNGVGKVRSTGHTFADCSVYTDGFQDNQSLTPTSDVVLRCLYAGNPGVTGAYGVSNTTSKIKKYGHFATEDIQFY